jgi:glycopeptide antibiotics resistance protein
MLFVVYAALLLKAVFFRTHGALQTLQAISLQHLRFRLLYTVNLIPFRTVLFYLSGGLSLHLAVWNLAGNLALLGPLGFLSPYVFPKVQTARQVFVLSFLVSLGIEAVQLLTGLGSFDVDDLILNVAGAMLGWLVYRGVAALVRRLGPREAHLV